MWELYEELLDKLQSLANEFGQSLQDFFDHLPADRAFFWEASLSGFLHTWRQCGLKVSDKDYGKLCKVLNQIRQQRIPADQMQAAVDCLQRYAADRQGHPGEMPIPEPASPEEAALPRGVRQFGHGIMRRHPIERWLDVIEDALHSWRFAEGVPEKLRDWIAAEQQARFARFAEPTSQAENDDSDAARLALAPDQTEEKTGSADDAHDDGGVEQSDSADENVDDLPWVNFDRHMENEGTLFYEANGQWYRVPVKKVRYRGEEVYDLRAAEKFDPSYVQRWFLDNDAKIDDLGWQAILRHYRDQYGMPGAEQLEKDLASKSLGQAFLDYGKTNGPAMAMGVLFGGAADRIAKMVPSSVLKKQYKTVQERLDNLVKRTKKKSREALEKELDEVVEELRNLANRETDAAAKKEVNAIADELDERYKKTKHADTSEADNIDPEGSEKEAAGAKTRAAKEFGITDWSGYPDGVRKPDGPFRLLEGAEYAEARKLANATNASLRRADPDKYAGKHIHEIKPVKFGGSPTDLANKIELTPAQHAKYTTFWKRLQRQLENEL